MVGNAVELIPAGDRGEFRITNRMMFDAGVVTMEAFFDLLGAEAQRRNLDIWMAEELPSRDVIVRWRPARDTPTQYPGHLVEIRC